MPTYDYECAACGHRFDELQSFSAPPLKTCPRCGQDTLVRLFGGGAAVIFKGSGFYETDYRRAGQKPSAKESSATGQGAQGESSGGASSETGARSAPAGSSGSGSGGTSSRQ